MHAHEIWEPAALVLGFQTASYAWRMAEESRVSRARDVTWLPVADIINLLSIATSIIGVYVLPVLGYRLLLPGPKWFGLSLLLFLGHHIALAGHYELFNADPRSMRYFPPQERIAVICVAIAVILYFVVALY